MDDRRLCIVHIFKLLHYYTSATMMIHQTARLVARAGMTGVAACRGSATRAASSLTVDNPYTPGERYCKVKLADSAGAATMVDKAAAAQVLTLSQ